MRVYDSASVMLGNDRLSEYRNSGLSAGQGIKLVLHRLDCAAVQVHA